MTPSAKPYSLGRTIAFGLATATAFALLSLFFLFMLAKGTYHRLSGEVVAVDSDSVRIRDARGAVTVLTIPRDAELRGVPSMEMLDVGQHLMTRGKHTDDGTFEVEHLRVLRDKTLR